MDDLAFRSCTELADLVRRRDVSPVELVELYLQRIEKFDGTLNSFVTVTADAALEAARAAEDALADGTDLPPFHGVPVTIKDLYALEGAPMTASSKALADHVPQQDAATVRRIKAAGFIPLGKTNTPEFGTLPVTESELNGACRNPWSTDHTPGGSSGGAAAGVAAGLAPIAQGSDGGGSIRIPASCCGLFGLKPSRGRVSHAPYFGESLSGLSTHGPIARTVADAAAFLDVIQGYETGDPYWAAPPKTPFADEVGKDPGRLRIGVTLKNALDSPVDPVCVAAVKDAAELLASLGHEVKEADPAVEDPNASSYFVTLWSTIATGYEAIPPERMEPLNRMLTELGLSTNAFEFVKAKNNIHRLARQIVAFWDDHDLLLTPTLALPPLPVGWIFEEEDPWAQFARSGLFAPFTPFTNLTGQPAVSVPLFWSDEGLPIGTQLVGAPADEATLIRVSAQLEAARPWADHRPVLS